MKCEVCGKSIVSGIALHRVNTFGEKGIWRCEACLTPEQRKNIDPTVLDIASTIQDHNMSGKDARRGAERF